MNNGVIIIGLLAFALLAVGMFYLYYKLQTTKPKNISIVDALGVPASNLLSEHSDNEEKVDVKSLVNILVLERLRDISLKRFPKKIFKKRKLTTWI